MTSSPHHTDRLHQKSLTRPTHHNHDSHLPRRAPRQPYLTFSQPLLNSVNPCKQHIRSLHRSAPPRSLQPCSTYLHHRSTLLATVPLQPHIMNKLHGTSTSRPSAIETVRPNQILLEPWRWGLAYCRLAWFLTSTGPRISPNQAPLNQPSWPWRV